MGRGGQRGQHDPSSLRPPPPSSLCLLYNPGVCAGVPGEQHIWMLLAGSGPPLPRATRTGVQLKEITVNPLPSSLLFLFLFCSPCSLFPHTPSARQILPSPTLLQRYHMGGCCSNQKKQEVKGKSETHPFKTQMVSSADNPEKQRGWVVRERTG